MKIKALVVGTWLTLSSWGHTTTLPYMNIVSLTKQADAIVKARVQHIEVMSFQDTPLTQLKIKLYVLKQFKPRSQSVHQDSIWVKTIGQQTRWGESFQVAGAPQFQLGEEIVVFLEKTTQHNFFVVLGMAQGKFQIVQDSHTGKPYALQHSLSQINLSESSALPHMSFGLKSAHPDQRHIPLDRLESLIEKYSHD